VTWLCSFPCVERLPFAAFAFAVDPLDCVVSPWFPNATFGDQFFDVDELSADCVTAFDAVWDWSSFDPWPSPREPAFWLCQLPWAELFQFEAFAVADEPLDCVVSPLLPIATFGATLTDVACALAVWSIVF
jgi:hypothetical protein